jgi:hypothetical protein
MEMPTLDQLIEKLPTEELKSWARIYGPAMIKMGWQLFVDTFVLLLKGDTRTAYGSVLANMSNAEVEAENVKHTEVSGATADDNAESTAAREKTAAAILTVIAMMLMGLL